MSVEHSVLLLRLRLNEAGSEAPKPLIFFLLEIETNSRVPKIIVDNLKNRVCCTVSILIPI